MKNLSQSFDMDMSFYCGCNEGYKNDKSLNTMSPSRATIGVI